MEGYNGVLAVNWACCRTAAHSSEDGEVSAQDFQLGDDEMCYQCCIVYDYDRGVSWGDVPPPPKLPIDFLLDEQGSGMYSLAYNMKEQYPKMILCGTGCRLGRS